MAENKLSVYQKNWKQQPMNKAKNKKPVKVVYISNPMKVKASAEEFRSVVQELTGQDSDVANLFSSVPADAPDTPAASKAEPSGCSGEAQEKTGLAAGVADVGGLDPCGDMVTGSFESFAEAFSPQMLDVIGYNSPSSSSSPLYYEGNGFRNL